MGTEADGNFSGKHLVVFGCGYLGGAVAREGVARGLRVTALTRNEAQAGALRAEGIAAVVADLASDRWHAQIAAPAYALNCVGAGGSGLEDYRRSYVDGMASLLAWARAGGGAGTLIFTSSTSVYPQDGGVLVDESSPTQNASERGQVLLEAEERLRTAADAARRWFILRLAGIYGPGRQHVLEQVRRGELAGQGRHRLNIAHRDDIVSAIWAAFAAPSTVQNEIFNVADDAPAPKGEVAAWLATRIGAPPPRFTGEPFAGRRAVTPDRVIANARLKQRLGWRPKFPTFRHGYENLLSR